MCTNIIDIKVNNVSKFLPKGEKRLATNLPYGLTDDNCCLSWPNSNNNQIGEGSNRSRAYCWRERERKGKHWVLVLLRLRLET